MSQLQKGTVDNGAPNSSQDAKQHAQEWRIK